ncbi:hypothetical protein psyc5s11_22450 [Clostridium gelidum]|uniref:Acyltransferase 3 domain-containing protein n=1 Tax=Clostridium gelidum TaxID=704125 RepID=A0ABM7T2L3_9CLOT|nr:acyltransferase family protein [Clostridium gelidum]BCZ46178.1 hypothetical protein psyc5s11_22450 [Clostridium gelidum]
MKERNLQLDILKIMACFAVVVIHVTGIITFNMKSNYTINHTLYYMAGFAVPIFFIVNGYFQLNKEKVNYTYVMKKIGNILIVVFVWNLIVFLLSRVVTNRFLTDLLLSKKTTNPFSMTLNSLIQRDYFWQFWFFGSIIIIYAVLPLLIKCFASNKRAIVITVIFIVCCLIVDSLSISRSLNKKPIIQIGVIQTLRLWTWFAYYLLGGLLGKTKIREYILNKISGKLNIFIFVLSSIIISVYQYNMAHKYYHAASIEFFYDNIFDFIWVISLFFLIYNHKFKVNSGKFIGLVSDKIMGIYIVHVTVLNVSTHFYKFNTPITNILLIFIVFGISLALTLIISKIPIVNRLIRI